MTKLDIKVSIIKQKAEEAEITLYCCKKLESIDNTYFIYCKIQDERERLINIAKQFGKVDGGVGFNYGFYFSLEE